MPKALIFIFCVLLSFIQTNAESLDFLAPRNCEPLNSSMDDFAPSWNIYLSQLYFNSTRDGYSKFYTSKRLDSIDFDSPKLLISEINKNRNNQSYITFLSKDEALYSTFRSTETQSFLNIFKSVYIRQGWSEPIKDDNLISDSFSAQPTISPDGSVLVFVSDRQAPFKDTDLWIAYRQSDGTWGSPVSIEELNSRGNEITPFLKSDDSLFFATNGQEGPGGYDVFYSVKVRGRWSPPRPLQSINTPFDESDFIILPDGNAMFASNMPGGKGKLDLYIAEPLVKKYNVLSDESIELSLKTQASSIEIQRNTRYIDMPMPVNLPLEYFDKYENEQVVPGISLGEYIRGALDTLDSRISRKEGKLISIEMGDSTLLRFLKLIGFSGKAVEYKFGNVEGIEIKSSDPLLLAPVRFSVDSFAIKPAALDIELDVRPREKVSGWKLHNIINNDTLLVSNGTNELPYRFLYDLTAIGTKLGMADSLILDFIAFTGMETSKRVARTLNIYRSATESRTNIVVGNKSYDMFLFSENEILNNTDYPAKISDLISTANYTRQTEIVYFSDSSRQTAEKLKSLIQKSNKRSNTITTQEPPPVTLNRWYAKNFILVKCYR